MVISGWEWDEARGIVEDMRARGWVLRLSAVRKTYIARFVKHKIIQDPADEIGDLVYTAEDESMPAAVRKAAEQIERASSSSREFPPFPARWPC